MQLNPDTYALDCENYRLENGRRSLFTYMSRRTGRLYVVKKDARQEVVLVGVFSDSELTVTPDEFAADFLMHVPDEAVFLFGTKEQQESARRAFEAESRAVKLCVYDRNQLPVVASSEQ